MKTAQFEYKCRRCDEVAEEGMAGYDFAYMILIELSIREHPKTNHGIPMSRHGVHHCKDGGMGISDCLGFKIRDDE